MSATLVGIVNSARPISAPDGSYNFYALDVVTSRGMIAACQVWDNDQSYAQLLNAGEQLVNHKVQVTVTNYNIGYRETKNQGKQPQLRFRVTKVKDLGLPEHESSLVGIVSSARPIIAEDGSYQFLAIDIVTRRGTTYACQIWDNDPEYVRVGPVVEQLKDHKVRAAVVNITVGTRTMKDGSKQPQARFRITAIQDLGIPDEED